MSFACPQKFVGADLALPKSILHSACNNRVHGQLQKTNHFVGLATGSVTQYTGYIASF